MKHFYLVGLLAFISWHAMSQTFQKSLLPTGVVPITTLSDYNPGFSVYNNYENRLHNYEAPFMNSLLDMYETTKDPVFLDRFMFHAYNVLERRDDILLLDPSIPVSGLDAGVSVPGGGQMVWSHRMSTGPATWTPEIVNQGTIAFPMAKFAYMIKVKYPALQSRLAPASITGWDATGWYYLTNFADCAEFLKIKVDQTARIFLETKWNSTSNVYLAKDNAGNDIFASPNYISSIGRVHVYMHKIYQYEGNTTLSNYYLAKIRAIGQRLVNYTSTGFSRDVTNHIISWKYGSIYDLTRYEDISHAILFMEFADLCNLFGITGSTGSLLFDDSLMYDLANTFKTKMITGPLKYSMSITGNDSEATQIGTPAEGTAGRYDQYMNAGRYSFLARHIPDIYNMIADYFYEFGLYGPGTYPMYIDNKAAQCSGIDAVSKLALGRAGYSPVFQNYLDIISVKRTPTYHTESDLAAGLNWKAVAAGKFDAAKTADLFVTAKSTGAIELHQFDPATKAISNVITTYSPGFTADWGGITAGDFIPGNNQLEFVAFNKSDKNLYLFRYNGTAIVLMSSFASNINWAGIACGNLDVSTATDEIALLSKDNGQVYVYKISSMPFLGGVIYYFSALTVTNASTSAYVVSEASKIAIGNLDKNLTNGLEIVTLNNNNGSDYNIKVLNYTFSGSNMTFSSAVSYTGTTGNYSQWDGLIAGDFNADGYDEIMLHRDYDGDFHIQYLDGGIIKSLCKENFPTNWDLGVMCPVSFPGSSTKHVISLRNNDGHMFVFLPYTLPAILNRPVDPQGPNGMITHPFDNKWSRTGDLKISPNPTNGVVQILLPEENSGKMTVISSLGQVILEVEVTDSNRNQKIDLSDYPSGIYLLKVETKEGIITGKIWKE
ncbi:T9SS type A sorting domain-containing protein [Fluviicola sp.]|uniref:T9SS type A sorting domain-containing protein n=1 Tax=Fluviicola sp. TaxID=1917219 RepID=UPI0031E2C65E